MGRSLTRRLLLVIDEAEPAVELIASLFSRAGCTIAFRRRASADSGWQGAQALARLLRRDGYEVALVVAGADANRRLSRAPPPDAVVIDVGAATERSLSVARHARCFSPTLPLLFVSSTPDALTPSCTGFRPRPLVFAKPLDYAAFSLALRRAARAHSGELVRVPMAMAANDRISWPEGG